MVGAISDSHWSSPSFTKALLMNAKLVNPTGFWVGKTPSGRFGGRLAQVATFREIARQFAHFGQNWPAGDHFELEIPGFSTTCRREKNEILSMGQYDKIFYRIKILGTNQALRGLNAIHETAKDYKTDHKQGE